jgi:hypothetical protein
MIRADRRVAFVVAGVAIAVVAAVNLFVAVTPAAAGPVEVLLQARNVSADANVEINGVTDAKTDSKTAPDAGPFNASASADASATDANQTISGSASASQDSQLLGSRFSFAGHLAAGGSLSGLDGVNSFDFDATAATDALINFRLDQRMTLTPTVNVNDNFEATKDNSTFVLEVTHLGGELVADFRNVFPVDLDAGDYTLSFNYTFGPSNSSDFENKVSDYDIAIDFAAADGGGGGGGAIPLPPGLLLGCAGLALAEGVRRSRAAA